MRFVFIVEVELEREEGKFASRDELQEQIAMAIADADPGSIEGGQGGTYAVTSWNVEEEILQPKRKPKPPKPTLDDKETEGDRYRESPDGGLEVVDP